MGSETDNGSDRVNAAAGVKARLRADLKTAMRDRAAHRVRALRTLIAALDNAEAIPSEDRHTRYVVHAFGDGSAEVPRKILSKEMVDDVLRREAVSRRDAAGDLSELGKSVAADDLLVEAVIIEGYLQRSEQDRRPPLA